MANAADFLLQLNECHHPMSYRRIFTYKDELKLLKLGNSPIDHLMNRY